MAERNPIIELQRKKFKNVHAFSRNILKPDLIAVKLDLGA